MTQNLLKPRRGDHTLGSRGSPFVLIVYADFLCPYSRELEERLHALREMHTAQEPLFIFRHFPISGTHEWAELAALAAEAAALQGRFWEMHDKLFERQGDLRFETIYQLAEELDLDITYFSTALQSWTCRARVEQDACSADELSLQRTPSLFMNGELYEDDRYLELFSATRAF